MTRILLLASQHGDEHLGEGLYRYMQERRPELLDTIEYMVANPEARKRNVRYIESDLNRSYNGKSETYEERRAAVIQSHIERIGFDLVLDMHTTSCEQPPCLIIGSVNSSNRRFIEASSIKHLVVMDRDLVKTSLNGVCPQVISVEINRLFTDEDLESLSDDIERYVEGMDYQADKYVYEVQPLSKTELKADDIHSLKNFKLSKKGFYPVLVGESSYQKQGYEYIGFKADRRYNFKAYKV